ncbi:putative mitogillin family ribonuclease Hirsutellin [Aspergillus clavatus NRRL 1]|uniref:Mitogillin family ribonuclease Hirsutellin, putative n=1 Tax=Aspergillus clavatus (strain ATCC 1007 / CBS 513.65 / DSM 816 / NCTC 3887 / NRRL 1 / QM 1276 / 107) TaxID=344612 RepID=A1CDH8_ASPCL|nr:mitogillin family ribonuclease Hirsutellin, putative [Aspergillus clavatus NRRL 1]EAW11905.1 mitogillin family ribonuclease Hirsutellin, putative [Aspergillus clavatus NRRL 1]
MHFTKTILAVALAFAVSPIAAAPAGAESAIEARANTVTCKTTLSGKAKSYTVSVDTAKSEAIKIGFTHGSSKSDYPHPYGDKEKLWAKDVNEQGKCNSKKNMLEYPIYWVGSKDTAWKPDEKKNKQNSTPIRVVYSNLNGVVHYCGVMIHEKVDAKNSGSGDFVLCK